MSTPTMTTGLPSPTRMPAIWIHEGLIDPYYHTEGDTLDHIDFEKLTRITHVARLCASRLACLDKLPF